MNEKEKLFQELFSDEAFVKSLLEAENEEAVQKMLAEKGVELSLTEIEILDELLGAVQDGKLTPEQLEMLTKSGELSEDDLENVAGGGDELRRLDHLSEKTIEYFEKINRGSISSSTVGWIAVGIAAAAGVGYGIYTAVRRRW